MRRAGNSEWEISLHKAQMKSIKWIKDGEDNFS